MIAIIVVVVVVAVFGIASVVLFVVAKRRQWNVRASIKRASRRLTGRGDRRSEVDKRKRSGMVAGAGARGANSSSRKGGLAVEVVDEEKGAVERDTSATMRNANRSSWMQRLRGNDWK